MKRTAYLTLRRKLISSVAPFGVKVSFRQGKFKRNSFGVSGAYSARTKRISITMSGNVSYSLILMVLAHEVRHAEHHRDNLFSQYYNPLFENKDYREKMKSGEIDTPCISIGLAAENDCNVYAVKWMKDHGAELDPTKKTYQSFFEPYPAYEVLTYRINPKSFSSHLFGS